MHRILLSERDLAIVGLWSQGPPWPPPPRWLTLLSCLSHPGVRSRHLSPPPHLGGQHQEVVACVPCNVTPSIPGLPPGQQRPRGCGDTAARCEGSGPSPTALLQRLAEASLPFWTWLSGTEQTPPHSQLPWPTLSAETVATLILQQRRSPLSPLPYRGGGRWLRLPLGWGRAWFH